MFKYPFLRPFLSLSALIFLGACASCGGGGGGGGGNTGGDDDSSSGGSSSTSSTSSSGGTGTTDDGPFIVVDQFGYLPSAQKVAVIRDPQTGFDADESYGPSSTFQLVNDATDTVVFSDEITEWNNGAIDTSSGDRVWWFDFSSITATGDYYVRDATNTDVVSPVFAINADVYDEVLKQAMRTFFYQRAGHAKQQPYADAAWADGASHLQDASAQARLFSNSPDNPASQRDLSGGWYDAGDYNKYTNWTADYVIGLLHAYLENPAAWGDDFNIPESNNGTPDIIDEVKWGMDSLIRLQTATGNGSVLSIVDLGGASPPSAANQPSRYGPANTSATLTTAAAFALGATVFAGLDVNTTGADDDYASQLETKAIAAWDWADANPDVFFQNNDGSNNLGAGQQDVNAAGLVVKKLEAAVYLYELTNDTDYRSYFDANYTSMEIIGPSNFANEFSEYVIHFLLYYANLPGATGSVETNIETKFVTAMNGGTVWGAINSNSGDGSDPYRAPLLAYTWGSAGVKAGKGNMFYEEILYDLRHSGESVDDVKNVAARYIHYLHGVNPLGKVFLSNMGNYGAENSVTEFYHTWFSHGSSLWDKVGESTHGPAPGFLVGGPNPSYDWDNCCNANTCGSPANNAMCARPIPPYNQPNQKSYSDFNNSWPVNSWSVTENSNGYQIRYLRLLSKFVNN
jgi:endoglucanase